MSETRDSKTVLTKECLSWLWTKIKSALSGKVDKVNGKGLSTNDYTNEDKQKVQDSKQKQEAVTDPTASGSTLEFISSITQDTNGVITPSKKNVSVSNELNITAEGSVLDARTGKTLNDKFSNYVPTSSIVNNLTTSTTGSVLDASQGKALNDKFSSYIATSKIKNNLTTSDTGYVLDASRGKALNDKFSDYIPNSKIVANLTTSTAGSVLDATQGKILKDNTTLTTVSNPVTWNTDNVTSAECYVTLFKFGDIRILRMKIYNKNAISAWTIMATLASGHRPANDTIAVATTLSSNSTQNARAVQLRTNGQIRMSYANASTSEATSYFFTVVYTV